MVFWHPSIRRDETDWGALSHTCNGFSGDQLNGYALELNPTRGCELMAALANEEFCRTCKADRIDYGVEVEHKEAYLAWLAKNVLAGGDMAQLKQAVYPLRLDRETLNIFGLDNTDIPAGTQLLVLGVNCD
ncbi:hypothetical protein KDX16_33660 [Burkholderia vietnamiensis]|uniref:Uncharacterized protein n=2 Tax=Burkholderia cepacia complex TaxID=87882 RepID=A0AAP4RAI1_9BURK|nr:MULTISPECIES: hypothetical protein [Burkholderia]HDR9758756.1 hypothetical protein [Burkholderia cepacia ATCC 25416]MBR7920750.1 hypothetical protein [Burkholderia vietnamiensis]MDN7570101.1 hypothetical protein [Burkholderia contaminans]OXI29624.1 hypothetical protein CFB84_43550 [Burkholderia aenigmatica]HDR9793986.1 hypothetical protein [Burkholderia cepacia ATCC 25416]